ncbi:MAG TPA: hypothetical protein PLM97_10890 [Nitrospira sp.]|nr:hypothetical protein [Nitrospira sp.]
MLMRARQGNAWTRKLLLPGMMMLATVLGGQARAAQFSFPPFPGDQNACYQYLSTNISTSPGTYGTDLRSHYDELTDSSIIATLQGNLRALSPPPTCTAANWTPVVGQIKTELSYVQTANDWLLGPTGSQTLLTQIFAETDFDVDSVSAKLQNVDPADQIAANLTQLFLGVGLAIGGSVVGLPPVFSNVFNQVSNYIGKHGGFPSDPNLAVGEVKGKLAIMYNTALNGNNDTHDQLVTDWSQLKAFAAPIVGTAPTDEQQKAMRNAGEMSYAMWLWQTLSPTRWHIVVPLIRNDLRGCYFQMVGGYPNPAINYPVSNNFDCGPAWIGDKCYDTQCNSPSTEAFDFLFKDCPTGQAECPDPANGPLKINPADVFLSRNGWSLPCVGTCPLQ